MLLTVGTIAANTVKSAFSELVGTQNVANDGIVDPESPEERILNRQSLTLAAPSIGSGDFDLYLSMSSEQLA